MAAPTPSTALTMKLLINSSTPRRRVVFAEASKDTVDFLFSLLAMPTGTAVKLLGNESMVGCIGNLYASVEKLDDPYVQPGATKDAVLCPAVVSAASSPKSSLLRLAPSSAPKSFFCCNTYYSCRNYLTDARGTRCPYCGYEMTQVSTYVSPGFVQGGIATYTVTDDLVISPMSNVSSIALLNKFAVRDLGSLQEKTVQIGYNEGLEILKASLQSKTVLTDVFIGKKAPPLTKSTPSFSDSRRNDSLTWRV